MDNSLEELIDAALMKGFSPFLSRRETRTKRVLRAAISFASVTELVQESEKRSRPAGRPRK